MSIVSRWLLAALISTLSISPLLAHHEVLAKFDSTKPRTLNGTVTKLDWTAPHGRERLG